MVLGQVVSVLLVGSLAELSLLPQVRGQVTVCLADGSIRGLGWKRNKIFLIPVC